MQRKIAIWASTIIGAPILYISIIWLIITYYPKHKFSFEKWKNQQETRYELTDDLINSKLLIGMQKSKVAQLLGKPSDLESNIWVYNVGFVPRLFNIDLDILEVCFENNKVVKVKQRRT